MADWQSLDNIYQQYYPQHRDKLRSIDVQDSEGMAFTARWDRGRGAAVRAYCVPTYNRSNGTYHLVCFGVDPTNDLLRMWCGDKTAQDVTGLTESRCNFWADHGRNNTFYMCKHCTAVYEEVRNDAKLRSDIEAALGIVASRPIPTAKQKQKRTATRIVIPPPKQSWENIISRDIREARFRI